MLRKSEMFNNVVGLAHGGWVQGNIILPYILVSCLHATRGSSYSTLTPIKDAHGNLAPPAPSCRGAILVINTTPANVHCTSTKCFQTQLVSRWWTVLVTQFL